MAIAALVFALLFAPVGIILGFIARGQIKRTGQGGMGLATAALIIGFVQAAGAVLILLIMSVLVVVNSNDRENLRLPAPTITETYTTQAVP